jgi:hypothetical protein
MQMGEEGMQNGFLSCLAISFRVNHNGLKSEIFFKDQFCNLTAFSRYKNVSINIFGFFQNKIVESKSR